MNQGWSHGGHFRKLHFYFYNSLKQTCFIFKHHSLCTTEYNLKVPEGSGQTWGPRRDSRVRWEKGEARPWEANGGFRGRTTGARSG